MSFESWRIYPISDLCDVSSSKRIYRKEYVESGVPFYRSKEIIKLHNNEKLNDILYISEERYNELKEKFDAPKEGDILLTSVGTIGVPYIVSANDKFYFKDGNLTWFRNFSDKFNSIFLYYWLLSPEGRNQINRITIGSTQKAITISSLNKMDILLPSIKEQKAIANILSTLDEKIEINNQINERYKQLAQELFKHWFIDFEFPTENGDPYKSSGGEMFESELGIIPKGWKVGCLSDLVEVRYGKDHKNLKEGHIPVYGSGGVIRYVDTALYTFESVLVPRKGTLNNVMYINHPFWSVDTMFYTVMKEQEIAKFIYCFLKTKDLASMNIGSAVPSMTTAILNKMPIIIQPLEIINRFNRILDPIFAHIGLLLEENKRLVELRDNLLKKLMKGEISVS